MTDRLLIFARAPEPGRCKTRLIPALGADGAARLHAILVAHSLQWAARLPAQIAVEVRYTGDGRWFRDEAERSGLRAEFRAQETGDLGARLACAFEQAFDEGFQRVAAVGTDCPELTELIILDAFMRLATQDAVIGPACDGGYYLIGTSRRPERLFEEIPWGTSAVLDETQRRLESMRRRYAVLASLQDVDRPEDLALCRRLGIEVPAVDH